MHTYQTLLHISSVKSSGNEYPQKNIPAHYDKELYVWATVF